MKIQRWVGVLTILFVFSFGITGAYADGTGPGIAPASVEQLVFPGESFSITKTVTTPEILPMPDIYFLADNTGSMGPAIANVKANAGAILTSVVSSTNNPRFGAGSYRDFPNDAYAYQNQASIPAADDAGAAALAGINSWTALLGWDEAEGQLFALDQIASGVVNWRTDSSRIVVWFGDSAGHDPVCAAISGLGYDITEASVTAKLVAAEIRVIAINVTGTAALMPGNLNGDPTNYSGDYTACAVRDGAAGQPERIAAATGGVYFADVPADQVAAAIMEGLGALPVNVSMASDCAAPITTTFAPPTQTVTSGLDAVFTETVAVAAGAASGTYTCKDWALVNGVPMTNAAGDVLYENKTIHVPGIVLAPLTATNELLPDATHTVTATIAAGSYGPVAGVRVQFNVISGPQVGATGSGLTDALGQVSFTYGPGPSVNPAELGTDTIQADFTNADGSVIYGSATATKTWVDTTPPDTACLPSVNPSGKNIPRAPGKGGKGQNQDGFYLLRATDIVWPAANIQVFVTDTGSGKVFGPFKVNERIKYTEAPGVKPKVLPMFGAVKYHILGKGDAMLTATDGSGNTSAGVMCLVPPKPK